MHDLCVWNNCSVMILLSKAKEGWYPWRFDAQLLQGKNDRTELRILTQHTQKRSMHQGWGNKRPQGKMEGVERGKWLRLGIQIHDQGGRTLSGCGRKHVLQFQHVQQHGKRGHRGGRKKKGQGGQANN